MPIYTPPPLKFFPDGTNAEDGGAGAGAGAGIQSAAINGGGHLILTRTDGSTIDAGQVVGATGTPVPPSTYTPLTGVLPGVVFVLDPAAPAGTAALVASTPGQQIDASNNVLAYEDPQQGIQFVCNTGALVLHTTGGSAGKPYWLGTATGPYDGLKLVPGSASFTTVLTAAFATPKQPFTLSLVASQDAPGGDAWLKITNAAYNQDIVILPSSSDGALQLQQNNTGLSITEPATAIAPNTPQIITIHYDGATAWIFRQGAKTASATGTAAGLSGTTVIDFLSRVATHFYFGVLCAGNFTLAQHNAHNAALAAAYGVTGVQTVTQATAGDAPPAPVAYVQVPHIPSGPVIKSTVEPYGFTLATAGQNVFDATFGSAGGAGVTIDTYAKLASQFWFRAANPNDPNVTSAQDQQVGQLSVHQDYPFLLSDGVTPNPLRLLDLKSDHVEHIVRSVVAGSSMPGTNIYNRFESGYTSPIVNMLPGMTMEIDVQLPNTPDAANAWFQWYSFTNSRIFNALPARFGTPSAEWDHLDNWMLDGGVQDIGSTLNTGVVLYDYASTPPYVLNRSHYGNPRQVFVANDKDFAPDSIASNPNDKGNADGLRFTTSAASSPSASRRKIVWEWRDANTMIWRLDGKIFRILHCGYPSKLPDGSVAPIGVNYSLEYGVTFNPTDMAAISARNYTTNPLNLTMKTYSFRIWNSVGTDLPVSATASPGTLPAPQTGGALGTLPAITTGTYVLNIDASSTTPVRDAIGSNIVRLVGNAAIDTTDQINGKPTISMTTGAVSVTGPVCFYAQGGQQVYLFVVGKNRAPNSGAQTIAQFSSGYPLVSQDQNKLTLNLAAFTPGAEPVGEDYAGSSYSAYCETTAGTFVAAATGSASSTTADLVSMAKTIASDGTIVLAQGYSQRHALAAASGGIATSALSGITELTIGCGRGDTGVYANPANMLLCQVVAVAVAAGSVLSATDYAAIETYLQTAWATTTAAASTIAQTARIAGYAQPTQRAATYNGTDFFWLNQKTAALSAPANGALTVSAPAIVGDQIQALVAPVDLTAPGTYTAVLTITSPGKSYRAAGLLTAKTGSNRVNTLIAQMYAASGNAASFIEWKDPTKNLGIYATAASRSYLVSPATVHLRLVSDGASVVVALSGAHTSTGTFSGVTSTKSYAAGDANSWDVLWQGLVTDLDTPTHLGVFVDNNDATGTGEALTAAMSGWGFQAGSDIQAATAASVTAGGTTYLYTPPPSVAISALSSTVAGGTATLSGTYANGAQTASALSVTIDGAAVTIAAPTVTPGTPNTGGTWSCTFTVPAAGAHSLVAAFGAPNNCTSTSYAITTTAPPSANFTFTNAAYDASANPFGTGATGALSGGSGTATITMPSGARTYELRYKTTSMPSTGLFLTAVDSAGASKQDGIQFDSGSGHLGAFAGGSYGGAVGGVAYTDGNWHSLMLSIDPTANSQKLYVDGVLRGTNGCSNNAGGSTTITLDTTQAGTASIEIAELRISNIARAAPAANPAQFVRDANTVGLWHLQTNGTNS